MKKTIITVILFISIIMLMAERVVFQEDPTDPISHCVDGHVYVYNSETGEWDSPKPWEMVSVKIYSTGNYNISWQQNNNSITNGYYCVNCSSYSHASSCDRVRVFFRGQYYYGDYKHSTGTTVDIWFYPDR